MSETDKPGTEGSLDPSRWRELEECEGELSNFDFTVDAGVEEALRTGKHWSRYAGWDFFGHVWFEGEQFHCDVWQYRRSDALISAPTIEGLMTAVSDRYGYA